MIGVWSTCAFLNSLQMTIPIVLLSMGWETARMNLSISAEFSVRERLSCEKQSCLLKMLDPRPVSWQNNQSWSISRLICSCISEILGFRLFFAHTIRIEILLKSKNIHGKKCLDCVEVCPFQRSRRSHMNFWTNFDDLCCWLRFSKSTQVHFREKVV